MTVSFANTKRKPTMNDQKIKQQIVEKLKSSSNILITVSSSPSVDELSAALGLTLLVNKMDKHGTAIFSGSVPPAITFLEPDKTFENTTDSLRDFIIALDKEKADHLRYKLEGDLVKIYITPYRSTISSDDLEFSQGDYNVELVVALGVENKDHLDEALAGHGRILHDATVVTITAGEQTSNLGSIDWHDDNASSLSEMMVTLYDALKLDKSLLDKSIATAYLTGIVSATERFSNTRTTSRVMTVAAQLMAAGADQQLIASQLAAGSTKEDNHEETTTEDTSLDIEKSEEVSEPTEAPEPAKKPNRNGELSINHEKKGTLDEVAHEVATEQLEASAKAAERALEEQVEQQQAQAQEATSSPASLPEPVVEAKDDPILPPQPRGAVSYSPTVPSPQPSVSVQEQMEQEPLLGGTLNATTEQAEDDKRREIESDKNKVILSHNYIGNQQPTYEAPINAATQAADGPSVDIFNQPDSTPSLESQLEPVSAPTVEALPVQPPVIEAPQPVADPYAGAVPTLADIDAQNRTPSGTDPHAEARAAIDAAFGASASTPNPSQSPQPQVPSFSDTADLPLPPPLPPLPPELSALPPLPGQTPERLGDILTTPSAPSVDLPQVPPVQSPSDPAQFRIPGQ